MENQSVQDAQRSINNAFQAVSQLEATPHSKQTMNGAHNAMEHARNAFEQVIAGGDRQAINQMEQQMEDLRARFEVAQDNSNKHLN